MINTEKREDWATSEDTLFSEDKKIFDLEVGLEDENDFVTNLVTISSLSSLITTNLLRNQLQNKIEIEREGIIEYVTKLVTNIKFSPSLLKVHAYLVIHGAGTNYAIRREVHLSRKEVNQMARRLVALREIRVVPNTFIKAYPRGRGRPANLYAINGSSPEQIRGAISHHERLVTGPVYDYADNLAMEYEDLLRSKSKKEFNKVDYSQWVKLKKPNQSLVDVVDIGCKRLENKGFRCWK